MGGNEVGLITLIAAVAVVIVLAVAGSFGNAVVEVADEMATGMSVTDVEALIGEALASIPSAQARPVLPGTWTLTYRRHPRYSVVLGVLTLPVGLLLLILVRETLLLTVSVTRAGERTRVVVVGRAHAKLAVALGESLQRLLAPQAQSV
jgi:hypothetical protein